MRISSVGMTFSLKNPKKFLHELINATVLTHNSKLVTVGATSVIAFAISSVSHGHERQEVIDRAIMGGKICRRFR